MHKFHFRTILCLLLCLCLLPVAHLAGAEASGKKVTVMVYMCGSNLESGNMAGTRTISEIIGSHFNAEEVNVVVLIGGSVSWASGYPVDALTILEIGGRRPRTVETLELANMGDGNTLLNFLNYCKENYPAENYDLVVWDHGGGPIYGVCQDSLFHDTMDMFEMSDALSASPFSDKGLDLILFHACLMGSAEVANILSPYAQYMVATEDSQYGLSYNWLTDIDKDADPLDTAKRAVDLTYEFNEQVIHDQAATEINAVSVIDLDQVAGIVTSMDSFFDSVTVDLNEATFTTMSNQRRDVTAFGLGDSGNVSSFDLVDLGDMVKRLSDENPEGAEAVEAALANAVVYSRVDRDTCTGLTVYHPFLNKQEAADRMGIYTDLGFSESYTSYLQSFSAILMGTPLADWIELVTSTPRVSKDIRTLFNLTLTEDQLAHFGEASLEVLLKGDDDTYTFTSLNRDASLNEQGQLTSEFSGTALYAVGSDDAVMTGALEYSIGANGAYMIPAVLTDENGDSWQAIIACTLDPDTKQLAPGSVLIWEEAMNGYTSAHGSTLADYTSIALTTRTRKVTRDESGALLAFSNWDIATEEAFEAALDGSWGFKLVNDSIPTQELYACFQVTDSQNNTYSSEPLVVGGDTPETADVRITYDDAKLLMINNMSVQHQTDALVLSGAVENISETEAIIRMENVAVNGEAIDASCEIVGNGENWGLLTNEESLFYLSIPDDQLAGIDTVTSITFDLTMIDAATDEAFGAVPVSIVLELAL